MQIHEMWTDQIEALGAVRRMYFRIKYSDNQGNYHWAYFGSTEAGYPVSDGVPVDEYGYVSLPDDIQHLPAGEADSFLYEIAQRMGVAREALG